MLDRTVAALKAFQRDHGIPVSGTADQKVIDALFEEPTPTPEKPTPTPEKPTPTPEPTPEPQSGISMQSFLVLQCDMTLAEVQAVLNSEGKCTSSYDVMGTTSETWEFGSSILNGITCVFTDGKLSSKTQAGLTEGVPAPTKEQYNQCIEGMSYAEVAAILGEGELSSVIWIFGVEEATYEWGTILKSATISFSSGRLSTKYSYGLE